MIKILHCVSKMDRAGQESFIMNVYRNINRECFQFCFLCTDHSKGDFDDEIFEYGGEIYYLPQNPIRNGLKRYLKDIEILTEWLKNNKHFFDIIHLHTYHALDVFVHLEAARRAKVKRVVIHSHNTNAPHKGLHFIFRVINNLYKHERLACSVDAGIWLHGKINDVKKNIEVVYNGINVPSYRYSEEIKREYIEKLNLNGKKIVGHIGRFNYQKNHDFIIQIFEKGIQMDNDLVLLLIGKGECQDEIKELVRAKKLEKHVMFLGTRDDIPQLLSAMDVLLFPSLFEGLSVVLVEAQASGLPCLISDNILPNEENIVPAIFEKCNLNESPSVWAERLISILNKEYSRQEANRIMEQSHFNISHTVKFFEDFYSKQM